MKKKWMCLVATIALLFLVSCPSSIKNSGSPGVEEPGEHPNGQNPDTPTRVLLDNSANQFQVSVYWHRDRQPGHLVGTVGGHRRLEIDFPAYGHRNFYPVYYIWVEGREFPLRLGMIGDVFFDVQSGATTTVNIRPLSAVVQDAFPPGGLLVNDIFLYIYNGGGADALSLLWSGSPVTNMAGQSIAVNPGNNGLFGTSNSPNYISPRNTSNFSIGVGPFGALRVFDFPYAQVPALVPGHFYFLKFDGTAVRHVRTVPITLASASGAGGGHVPGANFANQLSWLQVNALSGGSYTIELSEGVVTRTNPVSLSFADRRGITITLRGAGEPRILDLSQNGSLLAVGHGVTLELGNNITLQGSTNNGVPLVRVDNGGRLLLNGGARIAGNVNISTLTANAGGAVRVNSGGSFRMNGGEITGNSAAAGGGGVFVASGGTFDMRGGSIFGNSSSINGGGAYIASDGIFEMRGGTIFGNNGWFSGGGVFNAGTFRISDGTIHGRNSAAWLENTLTFAGGTGVALQNNGTTQTGVFANVHFQPRNNLFTSNYTVRVENGFLW